MGKLLKVLVILIFILTLPVFWFGLKNFGKRELLIGRTHALEDFAKKIVTTIEATEPEEGGVVNHPEWDVDDVTDRPNDNPRMSSYWDSYDDKLEASAPTMSFRGKDAQLAAYYRTDASGAVVKDGQGRPSTEGKGTMNALLEEAFQGAKSQNSRLVATREQLKAVREQFEEVIDALNEQKKLRRDNLAELARARRTAQEKEDAFTARERDISRLNREKNDLEDTIASLNDTIAERDQTIADLKSNIERLRSDITKLTFDNSPGAGAAASVKRNDEPTKDAWTPGVKGKVVKVDGELSFVVVSLTPEAAAEIRPAEGQGFAPVEMMVRRPAEDGSVRIVTRLRIVNPPNGDNLAIADNIYGWEQLPVEVGDDVVY